MKSFTESLVAIMVALAVFGCFALFVKEMTDPQASKPLPGLGIKPSAQRTDGLISTQEENDRATGTWGERRKTRGAE